MGTSAGSPDIQLILLAGWAGTVACLATFLWLFANPRVRALIRLTILDSIRRAEFQSILIFAVVLLGGIAYVALSPTVQGNPLWGIVMEKLGQGSTLAPGVAMDSGEVFRTKFDLLIQSSMFLFAECFGLAVAFALAITVFETDRRQGFLLTILPKPVTRGEYLWGRGLGILVTVWAAWTVMIIEILVVFLIKHPEAMRDPNHSTWLIVVTGLLYLMKWACFLAILLLMTTRMPVIPGAIAALLLYVGGHVAALLWEVGVNEQIAWTWRLPSWFSFAILPHFHNVFAGSILDPDTNYFTGATKFGRMAGFIGWAWMYALVCGLWVWAIFRKKDL